MICWDLYRRPANLGHPFKIIFSKLLLQNPWKGGPAPSSLLSPCAAHFDKPKHPIANSWGPCNMWGWLPVEVKPSIWKNVPFGKYPNYSAGCPVDAVRYFQPPARMSFVSNLEGGGPQFLAIPRKCLRGTISSQDPC